MGFRDIKYAIRSLVHDRSVSVIVIACLALGIGVNATLFSVIDGVLIQPLPFAEPDRLFVLNETSERRGIRDAGVVLSKPARLGRADRRPSSSMAATSGRSIAISDGGSEAERFAGALVTWDMFPILGVPPVLGRHFNAERRSARRRTRRDV